MLLLIATSALKLWKNARVLLNSVAYTASIQLTQPPTLSRRKNKYQPKCWLFCGWWVQAHSICQ